jgi:hypothetical protein
MIEPSRYDLLDAKWMFNDNQFHYDQPRSYWVGQIHAQSIVMEYVCSMIRPDHAGYPLNHSDGCVYQGVYRMIRPDHARYLLNHSEELHM